MQEHNTMSPARETLTEPGSLALAVGTKTGGLFFAQLGQKQNTPTERKLMSNNEPMKTMAWER